MHIPSLRHARRILAGAAISCAMATATYAEPITYTMGGVADGSLGATKFSGLTFTVTVVADTTTIYSVAPGVPCIDPTQATFTIDGITSAAITTSISVAENANWQFIAIARGRCADTGPMWTAGSNPLFGSYDLASDLEMVALAMPSAPPGVTVDTSQGPLTLQSVSALTFTAQLGGPVTAQLGTPVAATGDANVVSVTNNAAASNFQGLWYNAPAESEAGWGINLAHQGDVIFATWYTYDATGRAWWLTMTANKIAENAYSGTLSQSRGPPFNTVPFSPAQVSRTNVGSGTLTFTDANNGSFAYTVNGITQTKAITRQVFGPLPTCVFEEDPGLALATNYQDLWYAAPAESESGWGVNFTHQGDTIFATWFTYDFDGNPLWLSATAQKSAPGVYTGTLNRTTGPPFNALPWDKSSVTVTPVGTLTLSFADGNSATLAYTVNGVAQAKQITRQVFRTPETVCL